jgi:hypothetical protein
LEQNWGSQISKRKVEKLKLIFFLGGEMGSKSFIASVPGSRLEQRIGRYHSQSNLTKAAIKGSLRLERFRRKNARLEKLPADCCNFGGKKRLE